MSMVAGIKQEVARFQETVKNLSNDINQSGASWNDNKYKELSALIRSIASSSKQVITSGDRVSDVLSRFEQIAQEDC